MAAAAQTRPVSGTWKQNMGKSPTKSSWLKSYVNKIEVQDANLKVTTTTVGDRGERTYDRTRVIGKEQKSQDREGRPVYDQREVRGKYTLFSKL